MAKKIMASDDRCEIIWWDLGNDNSGERSAERGERRGGERRGGEEERGERRGGEREERERESESERERDKMLR